MADTWITTVAATATATVVLLLASVSSQDAFPPELSSSLSPGCLSALMNMSDCMTFVEKGSNLPAPSTSCCPELAGVADRNLTCLCELLSRSDSFRAKVDYNRMLQLPPSCDISIPPATLCSDIGVLVAIPTEDSNPSDLLEAESPVASTSFKNGSGWLGGGSGGVGVSAPDVAIRLIIAVLLMTSF